MKYTSIAVLAVLGLADAHRHHHHHHHNLAQKDEEPAVTPDSNRATFEQHVKTAANVVATEHSSEADRTSTHADAMASQKQATHDKNAATRTKYQIEDVENKVHHNQWTVKNQFGNWAQVATPDSARSTFESSVANAAAVVAKQQADQAANDASNAKRQSDNAAATKAKKDGIVASRINQIQGGAKTSKNSRGWRLVWPVASLSQAEGSPEDAYKAKKQAVEEAAEVNKIQAKQEGDNVGTITGNHASAAAEAAEYSTHSKQEIDNVGRGGVHAARDALGWRMQMGARDTIGDAGYEPHVAQFVRPNIIYQTNDKSPTKW